MSKKLIENDYVNKKYNMLTILKFTERKARHQLVLCRCDCGNIKEISLNNIKNNHTKCCGCYSSNKTIEADYIGKVYGRLTVESFLRDIGNVKNRLYANCICECGSKAKVQLDHLKRGLTTSCGCYKYEVNLMTDNKHRTHGLRKTRIYNIYHGMKKRCYNSNIKNYSDYGGRDIKICDEWLNDENGFTSFCNWSVENGYEDNLSIDRIDNDKGYSPDNCRWTTAKIQCDNRRNNHMIEYNGKTQNMKAWATEYNLPYYILQNRINKYGWTPEKALTTPIREQNKLKRTDIK